MTEQKIKAFNAQTGADTGGASFTLAGEFQERFLRRRDVCDLTTIPPSTLHDYIRQGLFPKPYKLTESQSNKHGSAVWKWSEVFGWMNSRKQGGAA